MLLLGRLIIGGIIAAVATAAIVIYVKGRVTKQKIREQLKEKGVETAVINMINSCNNTVSVKDWESDQEYEIRGDDVDSSLYESQKIYI